MKAEEIIKAIRRSITVLATGAAVSAPLHAAITNPVAANYTLTDDETVDAALTVNSGATVDLAGHKLRWDARNERFIDDPEANGMMFRPSRAGFGVRQYVEKA